MDKYRSEDNVNYNRRCVAVSDVATIVIGGTPSRSVEKYWHGKIPWATAKDVSSVPCRYLDHPQEFITEQGLESSAAKLMPKGTVIITARGTVGALAQLAHDMAFNQTCYALIPKGGVCNGFLFYALKGTLHHMRALTYGTIFETITRTTFDNWYIPLPSLSKQHDIVNILGMLDDKIELNRRMNKTLEEMARSLFKSWFVDFEPVRAKMDGRWRPGESLPGLPAHLYDLFPDRLVDSELGKIPEGWKTNSVGEIAEYRNGLALQNFRPKENEARLPVLKITQLRNGYTDGKECAKEGISQECVVDDGDVVFSWSGSLMVKVWCGGRAALNQHLFKVTSTTCPKWFYLYWLKWHLSTFQNIAADKATTMGHIKRCHLNDVQCTVPKSDLFTTFDQVLSILLSQQISNEVQCRTLAEMRDALLSKLISGEVRLNGYKHQGGDIEA